MRPDKEVKKEFLSTATQNPNKFYATDALKEFGYQRSQCSACQRYFWSQHTSEVCGDSACQGKISIFDNNPSKTQLTYQEVWTTFAQHMNARGYKTINRYPTVARWNPTTDFTMASIAAFQPYVISGEVQPPANKLIIPQFCLRFGDVDNVGVTGSHLTGFVMIGQHQFVPPTDWDQNQAFRDLFTYLTDVVGLPKEEITLHEDAWAGGGNFGPCMEFFSRGVELCNQVYMLYEQTPNGNQELDLKVLDMGLGQERVAWFTQAAPTIYDATFPKTLQQIKDRTGVEFDQELYKKFAPYGTLLNLDEVDNIKEAWSTVADKVGVSVQELREHIEPMRAVYSIAEHARALLVALTDGALPGNAGGYYNLRVIYRRAQDFIDEHDFDLRIQEVAKWHAIELEELYPELTQSLTDVQELLDIEYKKHQENKKRAKQTIKQALKSEITTETLIELYDSNGISPELVKRYAQEQDVQVQIPDNFYKLVNERHEQSQQSTQTTKQSGLALPTLAKTEPLYYRSYDAVSSKAVVLHVQDNYVVLDRTVFYPTGGGQEHDTGTINDQRVVDVFKQGAVIVHKLKETPEFAKGDHVQLQVDLDRRVQLTQHHTAAHVLNGASKQLLGNHIWQAGAAKTEEKGRLDITHYEALSDEQLQEIEDIANEVVKQDKPVIAHELKKSIAEQEYGFRLYQGGAVPGNKIRVIEIPDFDVEACGGTHVHTTGELQVVKILKSTKIQDGVVRIEFVSGKRAYEQINKRQKLLSESMELLGIEDTQLLASRTKELFKKWKKVKKLRKKNKEIPEEMTVLSAPATDSADPLADAAAAVKTQEKHLPKTIKRFMDEWKGN